MSIQIKNWKEALGKTRLGKIAMVIFFGLLAVTISSCMLGCQTVQERTSLTVRELTTEQMFVVFGEDLSTWPNVAQKEYMSRVHGKK